MVQITAKHCRDCIHYISHELLNQILESEHKLVYCKDCKRFTERTCELRTDEYALTAPTAHLCEDFVEHEDAEKDTEDGVQHE